MKRRFELLGCLGVLLVIASVPATWYVFYLKGLRPTLLFSLPREECQDIPFGPYGHLRWGDRVDELCRKQGISRGPFFATLGKKVTEFRTDVFHAVHCEVIYEQADPERVHFYRYHPRYQAGTVHEP